MFNVFHFNLLFQFYLAYKHLNTGNLQRRQQNQFERKKCQILAHPELQSMVQLFVEPVRLIILILIYSSVSNSVKYKYSEIILVFTLYAYL